MFVTVQWTGEIIARIEGTGYERVAKPFNPDDLRAAARRALEAQAGSGMSEVGVSSRVRLLDLGAFAAYFVAGGLHRASGDRRRGADRGLVWPAAGVAAAWLAVTGWHRWIVVDAVVSSCCSPGRSTS